MRISDWSSDVCSSDLTPTTLLANLDASRDTHPSGRQLERLATHVGGEALLFVAAGVAAGEQDVVQHLLGDITSAQVRSEEHTSELQSLMRISYAVFCLKKKKTNKRQSPTESTSHYLHE